MKAYSWMRISMDFGVLVLFAWMFLVAMDFARMARYFPLSISAAATVLAAINLAVDLRRVRTRGTALDEAASQESRSLESGTTSTDEAARQFRATLRYLTWILGYVAAVAIAGMLVATAVFLIAFLLVEAKTRWWLALVGSAAALGVLIAVSSVLNLRWPPNLLGL